MIQIFFLDEKGEWGEKGEWREIKDLYWFEENGIHSFDKVDFYGNIYTFKILVDGVQVYPMVSVDILVRNLSDSPIEVKQFYLIQLHHQFDDHTNLCAQREIENTSKEVFYIEMTNFIEETKLSHPLPLGARWLVCNEESEYFVGVPA